MRAQLCRLGRVWDDSERANRMTEAIGNIEYVTDKNNILWLTELRLGRGSSVARGQLLLRERVIDLYSFDPPIRMIFGIERRFLGTPRPLQFTQLPRGFLELSAIG